MTEKKVIDKRSLVATPNNKKVEQYEKILNFTYTTRLCFIKIHNPKKNIGRVESWKLRVESWKTQQAEQLNDQSNDQSNQFFRDKKSEETRRCLKKKVEKKNVASAVFQFLKRRRQYST